MRLICPNCSAQYEVDGSMIPDDGRDVQCSNCGHTWFELPGPRDAEAAPEASDDFLEPDDADEAYLDSVAERGAARDTEQDDPGGTVEDDDVAEDEDEDEDEAAWSARVASRPENLSREIFEADDDIRTSEADDHADAPAEQDTRKETAEREEDSDDDQASEAIRALAAAAAAIDGDDDTPAATEKPKQRRPADAAALDILREEAERELSQRRAPPSEPIETQPDLGLEDIRNRRTPSRALRARMAHLGEEMPEEQEVETPRQAPDPDKTRLISQPGTGDDGYEEPRRDLLPDIEEINSTLKSGAQDAGDPEARERSGFRIGFLLVLFVTVAVIFAYAQAPAIARALPDAEPALISFVDWTNGVRDQIDGLIGN